MVEASLTSAAKRVTPRERLAAEGKLAKDVIAVRVGDRTVDLTEQLVNMIVAQRNFQANAQMISTQDQATQTVINIR